jgi:hypothetical protein
MNDCTSGVPTRTLESQLLARVVGAGTAATVDLLQRLGQLAAQNDGNSGMLRTVADLGDPAIQPRVWIGTGEWPNMAGK